MILWFLILLSAYGAFKIFAEIKSQKKCPDNDDLKAAVTGSMKKNTSLYNAIILHLGICDKCQEKANKVGSGEQI